MSDCQFTTRADSIISNSFDDLRVTLEHWLPDGKAKRISIEQLDAVAIYAALSVRSHIEECEAQNDS